MSELNVGKKNIEGLLSFNDADTKGKIFVIPEYQRPYRWEVETCDILWNDLSNFYNDNKNNEREYFLGSIVTCNDETNRHKINIIDGQQRITSLLLMLRAFYFKLEAQLKENPDDDEVKGLMTSIEPCIWVINPMTKKVTDKTKTHIETLVATDDDKATFNKILETGECGKTPNSYYAKNYSYFLECCDSYATTHLDGWKEFCLFVLSRCIVLPIECVDLESALTIFGTLNTRGLPLADSDIFKAELYKLQESKEEFSEQWKEMEDVVENANFHLDDVFRYYMFIDRAKNGERKKEIGLRAYYAGKGNKYAIFKEENFFGELIDLAEFWASIYHNQNTYCNDEGLKYIQCLLAYPNEYWKYPVSVFYHKNKNLDKDEKLKEKFTAYIKKLLSLMFVKFIENPSVNAVKPHIFGLCIDTYNGSDFMGTTYEIPADFNDRIKKFSASRITKALLLLNAYLFSGNQTLIPDNSDIEHIFPRSWQTANYNGWNKDDAKIYLDLFGNKVIFEKKLNIQAGNGYFGKKKEKYKESNIEEVKSLARIPKDDWLKEDIERRDNEIIDRLKYFFESNRL